MIIADIILAVVIAALITGALWKIRRDRKKGISCTGCAGCPAAGSCEHPLK